MTRFSAIVSMLAVGAALACGAGAPALQRTGPTAPAGLVYLSVGRGIEVVDVASGQPAGQLPAGTPSPDWHWIYVLGQSRLQRVDAATGLPAASVPVPGWAADVRTSPDGSWLVLTGPSGGPRSRFEVVDAGFARQPASVDIAGAFTFDGLSNDGKRLYLLQWVDKGHYQVRMYDVVQGGLFSQVISDKTEVGQLMSGEALTSLTTSDGSTQLTLYQRSAKDAAFVHELPISQDPHNFPFAFCEDLPAPSSGWSFVKGTRPERFYAVHPVAGWVIALNSAFGFGATAPQRARLGISASLPPDGQPAAAAVSPDGARLLLSTWPGLVAIDTGTLQVRGRFMASERIRALSFAPDGSTLYALNQAGSLLLIDVRTMTTVREIQLAAPPEAILHTT